MAYAFTVTERAITGNLRKIFGTFTSADGDSSGTLGNSVHGLNFIAAHNVSLDAGGLATQRPKVTISSGELTFVFDNAGGKAGRWWVEGR